MKKSLVVGVVAGCMIRHRRDKKMKKMLVLLLVVLAAMMCSQSAIAASVSVIRVLDWRELNTLHPWDEIDIFLMRIDCPGTVAQFNSCNITVSDATGHVAEPYMYPEEPCNTWFKMCAYHTWGYVVPEWKTWTISYDFTCLPGTQNYTGSAVIGGLMPQPEPSSLLAFASGIVGLGGVFFRRRRT
jgi:hypothetical protein